MDQDNLNIEASEQFLKGYLQNYSSALLDNRMTPETWQERGE